MAKIDRMEAERVLGITGKYDAEVLNARRRELVKKYHPDLASKNGLSKEEAEARTIELQAAYATLDSLVRKRGEVSAIWMGATVGTATTQTEHTARPEIHTQPEQHFQEKSNMQPQEYSSWETQAWNGSEGASQEETVSDVYDEGSMREPLLRRIIAHFPFRVAFLLLAIGLPYLLTGNSILAFGYNANPNVDPALYFALFGMTLAAILNLFTGSITSAAKQACLWFYDKMTGRLWKEPLRYAIFGHLPYRLMFLGFSMWWYWDFATFHVAESGALDWPLHVIVFLAAGVNFIYPLITEPVRRLLAGNDF